MEDRKEKIRRVKKILVRKCIPNAEYAGLLLKDIAEEIAVIFDNNSYEEVTDEELHALLSNDGPGPEYDDATEELGGR